MKSITVVIQVQRKNKWLESNAHSLGFFVDFYFYSLLLLLDYYFWTPSLMNHFKYPNADMFWSQTVVIKSRDPRLNKSAQKIKTQLHDYKKQIRAHSMTTILSQVSYLNIEKQTLHKTNFHARAFVFKVLNITIIAIIFLFSVFFLSQKKLLTLILDWLRYSDSRSFAIMTIILIFYLQ